MSKINITELDLLASREGSYKRAIAEVLLRSVGKPVDMDTLIVAAYGEAAPEWKDPVVMILKGIKKAIKVNDLTFSVERADNTVTLLPTTPAKKRKSKK
jgi:hypothetical protein